MSQDLELQTAGVLLFYTTEHSESAAAVVEAARLKVLLRGDRKGARCSPSPEIQARGGPSPRLCRRGWSRALHRPCRSGPRGVDVTSIALKLGYYDQSHFGRDFRTETGWAPARFRRYVRGLVSGGTSNPPQRFRSS